MTINRFFSKYSDWAFVFLRLGVGIIFLVHGTQKLMGIAGTAGFLGGLGFPAATLFAWILAIVETLGGLFLIIGLYTRLSALLLSINMVLAISLVHLKNGFSNSNGGYEFTMLLLFGALTLLFGGPGKRLALEKTR
jgi:putative oxidoreductase